MTRLFSLLSIGLTATLLPQFAAANSVTLDPGLYDLSHVVMMAGRALPADEYEYCVEDGDNSRTLEELLDSLAGDGECRVSNVNMTDSKGRADVTCTGTDLGVDISGTLEAQYGSDFYDIDTRAGLGPIQIHVKTKVRRRGKCPANWDNPDNVSVD